MKINIENVISCVTHPVKSRIVSEINTAVTCTAKELSKRLGDIPSATLYRALNSLTENGILNIVAENKVRAVFERVYEVNHEIYSLEHSLLKDNDGETYFKMLLMFFGELTKVFRIYIEKPDIDILNDGSGFSSAPFYATDSELDVIGQKIKEIISPYLINSNSDKEKKLRHFATVITPPIE